MSSSSSVVSNPLEPKFSSAVQDSGNSSSGDALMEEGFSGKSKGYIGVLDVYVHQAREIQNICIYHKQDVYAKICLTDDPETTVSTHTVNGGGRSPVFDENLRLNVRSIESSLKCEVWMLSRVKNYLQDQLLGTALVPLTEVVVENGKLAKEFTLSSSDMFHSPSGFVELTLAYNGASPEVLEISPPRPSLVAGADARDNEALNSVPRDFGSIEFVDPNIDNENEMMVTEYYGIPCANPDFQDPKSLEKPNDDKGLDSNVDVPALATPAAESNEATEVSKIATVDAPAVETFAAKSKEETEVSKTETLPSGVTNNGSPSVSALINSLSVSDTEGASNSVEDVVSAVKEKTKNVSEAPVNILTKPVISLNVEPEQKVVQQDYVDMYMKSMKQFTEALAKMKLPLDIGTDLAGAKDKDSDEKAQASKENGPSPRVFYGSRAFF